jgi:hypothetical protein
MTTPTQSLVMVFVKIFGPTDSQPIDCTPTTFFKHFSGHLDSDQFIQSIALNDLMVEIICRIRDENDPSVDHYNEFLEFVSKINQFRAHP